MLDTLPMSVPLHPESWHKIWVALDRHARLCGGHAVSIICIAVIPPNFHLPSMIWGWYTPSLNYRMVYLYEFWPTYPTTLPSLLIQAQPWYRYLIPCVLCIRGGELVCRCYGATQAPAVAPSCWSKWLRSRRTTIKLSGGSICDNARITWPNKIVCTLLDQECHFDQKMTLRTVQTTTKM